MADTDTTKTIRIVIDSSKAIDGSAQATRALQQIEQQSKQTADSLSKIEGGLDFAAMATKITAAVYVAKEFAGRLIEMWNAAKQAAAAVQDLSEQLGVSTTFVQASEFAAASNTVSIEKMTQGYTKATQIIGQAAQGQKDAVELMNTLGVKILDAGGKLRSTESILSDSAAAILKVEDPAKRVALAMDLFGKSGAQIIPMLKDLAAGTDVMASKAAAAGAMIEDGLIKQVADLQAKSETAALKWNALVLQIGTPIATAAMEAVNKILGDILANLDRLKREKAETAAGIPQAASDVKNINDQIAAQEGLLRINPNNFSAKSSLNGPNGLYARRQALQDAENVARQQYATQLIVSGSFPNDTPPDPEGKSNPGIAGAGDNLAKRIATLIANSQIALVGATAGAAAASQGPDAIDQLEVHTKDLKDVTDAYIKSGQQVALIYDAQTGALTTNSAAVNANVAALDKLNESTRVQNNLKAFTLQNFNLSQDNDNTALQLSLQGQTTQEIDRQVALQKAFNDEQAKGLIAAAQGSDDQAAKARKAIDDRTTEINKQYDLKTAIDETAKSTQLWLQPFSEALSGIQQDFTSFFENLINTGKASWQSLTDALKQTFVKTLAELATLALVRPIIVQVVQTVFSPGAAQMLGMGGGGTTLVPNGSGGYTVSGGGGLGGLSIPSGSGGGWLGRQFSAVGDFLRTPIFGLGGEVTPGFAAASVPTQWGDLGFADLSGAYGGLGGASAPGSGLLGATTWGQGLGAAFGIGSGALTLLNGGGSTSSTISGISQMIGGAVSLIPGIGQIAGPLIAIGGSILGSVLGGGPKIPPMPGLGYQQGTVGFDANGQVQSSGGYASAAGSIGQSVLSLISASGGTAINGKLYGGTVASGTTHTWDGQQWVGQGYTQANLLAPDGSTSFISGAGQGISLQDAADALAAAIFRSDVLNGAIEGLGPTLKQVLQQAAPTTTADVQNIIQMSNLFDSFRDPTLANNATAAAQAFDQIKQSMAGVTSFAQQYGLDTSVITNAQNRQEIDYAKNYMSQFATNSDPLQAQLDALDQQRQQAIKEANYLNTNLSGISAPVDLTKNSTISAFLANPNLTDTGAMGDFINAIYSGTFGRTADATGMAYWQNQLTSGTLTPGLLIPAIRGGAQGSDINAANTVGMETYTADINSITESFLKQEKALREQYYSESLSSLEDTIKRLTLGDLSTASPSDILSGTRATYNALLAQAQAGDINAANQLGGAAADYAGAGQSYYASSADYQAIRAQILSDLAGVYATEGGADSPTVLALETISGQLQAGSNDNTQLLATLTSLAANVQSLVNALNRQANAA